MVKNILPFFPRTFLKDCEWNIHFPWLLFTVKLNIKRGENNLASSFPEKNTNFQKGKVTGRNIWRSFVQPFHKRWKEKELGHIFFSPKASLKIRRESYCTCTSLSFQKFRKYFWLYSCVGKETKLYSSMGLCACLKDMFFVLKYLIREKVKMHHNVRQTGMMICGLVVDHLKDNIIFGGPYFK